MDWLTCLKTFLLVAKFQHVTAAAEALGTTPATVTKRIQWLEDSLKVSLFDRTTRRFELSPQGRQLLKRAKPWVADWEKLQDVFVSDVAAMRGKMTLAVSIDLLSPFVQSVLPVLMTTFPRLSFSIETVTDSTLTATADVYLGFEGMMNLPKAVQRITLYRENFGLFASLAYVAERGKLIGLNELKDHACLSHTMWSTWTVDKKQWSIQRVLEANHFSVLVEAAEKGLGIVYAPDSLAEDALKAKKLVSVYRLREDNQRAVQLAYAEEEFIPEKIIQVSEFLKQHYAA